MLVSLSMLTLSMYLHGCGSVELDTPTDEWKETERVTRIINQNGMFDTMF